MEDKNIEKMYSQNILAAVVIVSIVIGALAGAVGGVYAISNPTVGTWIQENVFHTSPSSPDDSSILSRGTIQVEEDSATVDVVEQARPAVVSIVVKEDLSQLQESTSPLDNFFFNFPAPQGEQQVGAGTGFIISKDGLIVTNKHVVAESGRGGETAYTVILNDGTQYDATVVDSDPFNDLALVRIDATDLPTLELGDSDSLQIGQTVIAIGNALGEFTNSVTKGVVSGLSRTITAGDRSGASETLEDIIQTDAAINFGNSGGPLLNLAGQVIGVNTAISQEGQLIGFAIPVEQATKVVESVEKYGKIVRPYLGVRYVLVNEAVAKEKNLSVDYGALLIAGDNTSEPAVLADSPAAAAGLVEGDVILEIDGKKISSDRSLARTIQQYLPGDVVEIKVLHEGEEKTVSTTLDE